MLLARTKRSPLCQQLGGRLLLQNQCRHFAAISQSKPLSDAFPSDIREAASTIEHARSGNYQIQPLSKSITDLDQTKGYRISAAIRELREEKYGDVVAGRKIGFTNRGIWPEYGIDTSNWSYVYDRSLIDIAQQIATGDTVELNLKHVSGLQPRIEPEIVLGISRPVVATMSDAQLLDCIEWIAHGFEIVTSIFPDWKFTAADTTAAFALHGLLLVGPRCPVEQLSARSSEPLLDQLSSFKIELHQNEMKADEGKGSNVLGSPIKALRHLVGLLQENTISKPLEAGEVVTTGTLTRALSINHGDVWSTRLTGIGLPGLRVRFNLR